jgi:hypothetical protein
LTSSWARDLNLKATPHTLYLRAPYHRADKGFTADLSSVHEKLHGKELFISSVAFVVVVVKKLQRKNNKRVSEKGNDKNI